VALISAVVGGSLDRAMDVAATLEVRGFATARSPGRGRGGGGRPLSRHDIAFAASAVAILALAIAGRLAGVASFDSYPRIEMPTDAGTLALAVGLIAATLLPFCDRRGIDP
jgi:energy-coupling factor transport system permease protein